MSKKKKKKKDNICYQSRNSRYAKKQKNTVHGEGKYAIEIDDEITQAMELIRTASSYWMQTRYVHKYREKCENEEMQGEKKMTQLQVLEIKRISMMKTPWMNVLVSCNCRLQEVSARDCRNLVGCQTHLKNITLTTGETLPLALAPSRGGRSWTP